MLTKIGSLLKSLDYSFFGRLFEPSDQLSGHSFLTKALRGNWDPVPPAVSSLRPHFRSSVQFKLNVDWMCWCRAWFECALVEGAKSRYFSLARALRYVRIGLAGKLVGFLYLVWFYVVGRFVLLHLLPPMVLHTIASSLLSQWNYVRAQSNAG